MLLAAQPVSTRKQRDAIALLPEGYRRADRGCSMVTNAVGGAQDELSLTAGGPPSCGRKLWETTPTLAYFLWIGPIHPRREISSLARERTMLAFLRQMNGVNNSSCAISLRQTTGPATHHGKFSLERGRNRYFAGRSLIVSATEHQE